MIMLRRRLPLVAKRTININTSMNWRAGIQPRVTEPIESRLNVAHERRQRLPAVTGPSPQALKQHTPVHPSLMSKPANCQPRPQDHGRPWLAHTTAIAREIHVARPVYLESPPLTLLLHDRYPLRALSPFPLTHYIIPPVPQQSTTTAFGNRSSRFSSIGRAPD
jgi:hypothetical protein